MLPKKIKMKKYLSLVKFSHTIFAMPFAFIGYFLAIKFFNYELNWMLFLLVILSMVFARNSAMAFNRFIDRKIDEKNPRTQQREIPAGAIKSNSALWFVIINSALFFATTFFINQLCFFLSPIALIVILGYSLTKRFTALCHLVLGIGLSLAPIGAFLAVSGKFEILPILFSIVVLLWVSGFDIIYALQDEMFDKSENLKSIPVFLGTKNALIFSRILHSISAIFVVIIGFYNLGNIYWIGALVFISMLIFQHTLVSHNNLSKVNLAFMTTNGIASVVFAIFTIASLYFC